MDWDGLHDFEVQDISDLVPPTGQAVYMTDFLADMPYLIHLFQDNMLKAPHTEHLHYHWMIMARLGTPALSSGGI
jgi:hypothetical protein